MKRLIVEFNRLSPILKTTMIALFAVSIVAIIESLLGVLQNKSTTHSFIVNNFTFTFVMQIVITSVMMNIMKKINKKETSDRFLRKDIFVRLEKVEKEMEEIRQEMAQLKHKHTK